MHNCPYCGSEIAGEPRSELSPQQSLILSAIMRRPGVTVTRERLIEEMYPRGDEPEEAETTLRQQISRIRRKMGDVIENTYGGYRLRETR